MHAADLGLLVMRAGLGVMLLIHGANKMLGPGGLTGTARWFESVGLRPGWLHARLAAAFEIGSGLLMAVGFLFPAAGAGFVGLMLVAGLTDHRGKGFFVFKGGWEYVSLVGLMSAALVAVGPGAWSVDRANGWHLEGLAWAGCAVVVGAVAGLGLLAGSKAAGQTAATD
ncbi:DoxX family protein [Streptomyces sp. NPDC056653]|uniref:DoxX family protein n=1 Tax=Streptomyces sp. NPDC056653 TaxID=3345894 RepID=UPI00368F07AF